MRDCRRHVENIFILRHRRLQDCCILKRYLTPIDMRYLTPGTHWHSFVWDGASRLEYPHFRLKSLLVGDSTQSVHTSEWYRCWLGPVGDSRQSSRYANTLAPIVKLCLIESCRIGSAFSRQVHDGSTHPRAPGVAAAGYVSTSIRPKIVSIICTT